MVVRAVSWASVSVVCLAAAAAGSWSARRRPVGRGFVLGVGSGVASDSNEGAGATSSVSRRGFVHGTGEGRASYRALTSTSSIPRCIRTRFLGARAQTGCEAAAGKDAGRQDRQALRNLPDGQTMGVPSSPDTSFLAAEIVMAAVDETLNAKMKTKPRGIATSTITSLRSPVAPRRRRRRRASAPPSPGRSPGLVCHWCAIRVGRLCPPTGGHAPLPAHERRRWRLSRVGAPYPERSEWVDGRPAGESYTVRSVLPLR